MHETERSVRVPTTTSGIAAANRWTQLTFTEDDPASFDLDRWVDIMLRTKSNGACISAGGYIAYYPTAIPFHYRSRHLGDRDLFGELVEAANSLDITVMARVDPHAVHEDAATAHPEWLHRDADGNAVRHWSFPDAWLTCPFTAYYDEVITDIAREIVENYDVDAVFANRWEGPGELPFSDAARRSFRNESGLELPLRPDHADPAWPEYLRWRRRRLTELIVVWNRAVRDVRPSASFIPNRGAMLLRDLDAEVVGPYYPAFFVDKQGRHPGEAIWVAGRVGRRSRGSFPDRPVSLITSVGPEHHLHRWKDSVNSAAELKTWIVEGFVNGATPWFTKFSASIHDDRWIEPIADAFNLHATVEPVFEQTRPVADVAMLDSVAVDDRTPSGAYSAESPSENGFYQALLDARIPFEYIDANHVRTADLQDFLVVVIPNAANLPPTALEAIREYVREGGSILADQRTSLVDGDETSSFALGDVFGVDLLGEPVTRVRNNYIEFDRDHPIAAGFAGATRIIGGTETLPVAMRPGASAPIRFVPPYPDLPMEEVYPRPGDRDPAVVTNRYGAGTAVYCAFNLGEVLWENLLADHKRLVSNMVTWLLAGRSRCSVHGEGLVDIACRESTSMSVISIVNLNSPFALRGELESVAPLGPQVVDIRTSRQHRDAVVTLLISGEHPDVDHHDDGIRFVIPRVDLLETARIDWVPRDQRGRR